MSVTLVAIAGAAAASVSPPPLGSCGRDATLAPVLGEFDAPDGPSIGRVFPALANAPELIEDTGPLRGGPLHVVVFREHAQIPAFYPFGAEVGPVKNVVCVVTDDGDPWYFSDVDDVETFAPEAVPELLAN